MPNFMIFSVYIIFSFFLRNVESKTKNISMCYDTKCAIHLDCEDSFIGLKEMDFGFKAKRCSRSNIDCSVTDPCCESEEGDCYKPFEYEYKSDALKKCQLKSNCAIDNRRTGSIHCQDHQRKSSFTTIKYDCLAVYQIISQVGKSQHFDEVSHLVYGGENFRNFSDVQCTINSSFRNTVNVEIQQLYLHSNSTRVHDDDCEGKLFIKDSKRQTVYCENGGVNTVDLDDHRTPFTVVVRDMQDDDHVWLTFRGKHDIICEDLDRLLATELPPRTTVHPETELRVTYTTIGIIIGTVVFIITVTLILFLWHRYRSKRKEESTGDNYTEIPMTLFENTTYTFPASQRDQSQTGDNQDVGTVMQYDEVDPLNEEISQQATPSSSEYNRIGEFTDSKPGVDFINYDHITVSQVDKSFDIGEYDHIRSIERHQPQDRDEKNDGITSVEIDEDLDYQHLK